MFCPLLLVVLLCMTRSILLCNRISRKIHLGHKIVAYLAVFLLVSLSQSLFIEPKGYLDQAMHIHDGKLPDLVILENEEPVDVVLKWGKLASKEHHPILRQPIYWDMLKKVCGEIKFTKCKRRRAWEYIDMGSITVSGQSHKIDYFNPEVTPSGYQLCRATNRINPCLEKVANATCKRIFPPILNCELDLTKHLASQLEMYNSRRLKTKKTYVKLGLEMDAPDHELFPRMAQIVRQHGMNLVPYNNVGNMSVPKFYPWDENIDKSYTTMDAYMKVKDKESREWNDKPCTPYFNGALCAKHDKDGNMIIEM